jgi:hypothetical protein
MKPAARWLSAVAQPLVIGGAAWFLIRTAREHWPTIARESLAIQTGPLLLASAITVLTYGALIGAWVYSLRWWGQRLRYRPALYIWFLTNLARFLPGAIWQFVGLAALAARYEVSPLAATAAVLLQQLLFLMVGVVVTLVTLPSFLGVWAIGLPAVAGVLLGGALLGGLATFFPALMPRLAAAAARLFRRPITAPVLTTGELVRYLVLMLIGWLAYGVAFWQFGQALLGSRGPGLMLSVGAFVASYVVGLLAIFAPGGIVVREAALVAALTPSLGASAALLLAVGSRLWLLALELATATVVVLAQRLRPAAFQV